MNRVVLKERAKKNLSKFWVVVIVATIIVEIATGGSSLQFINKVFRTFGIVTLLLLPIHVGYSRFHYNIAKGREADLGDLISVFNAKEYGRSFIGVLLMIIYIVCWMILLVIPGIIKMASYAMTTFILQDPEFDHLTGNEAITKSREIMNGHKMEFVVLVLSFLGWYILSVITFSAVLLYALPYMKQTLAEFYIELKKENN